MKKDKVVEIEPDVEDIASIEPKEKKKKITLNELSDDVAQLVDEVGDALEQIEKNFEDITEKVNKICTRLGISEL